MVLPEQKLENEELNDLEKFDSSYSQMVEELNEYRDRILKATKL